MTSSSEIFSDHNTRVVQEAIMYPCVTSRAATSTTMCIITTLKAPYQLAQALWMPFYHASHLGTKEAWSALEGKGPVTAKASACLRLSCMSPILPLPLPIYGGGRTSGSDSSPSGGGTVILLGNMLSASLATPRLWCPAADLQGSLLLGLFSPYCTIMVEIFWLFPWS